MELSRSIRRLICAVAAAGIGVCAGLASQAPTPAAPVVLDKVVAVVNNSAILESDLELEVRLTILEPGGTGSELRRDALDRLISRTLIQQQIREEELEPVQPSEEEVRARVKEIRTELPVCVHAHCAEDAQWAAFLKAHRLTEAEVDNHARLRLVLLAFIEQRFRQGIQISQGEIDKYYRDTLLPQYHNGETPPKLESVKDRIEEILLQEQVNKLFGAWLDNLRSQGNVEILAPDREPAKEGSIDSGGAREHE